MAENKVKFGLKNVHIAPITEGENGAVTFGTPFALPGAVNLSVDPQGDQSEFYADDMAYFVSYQNNGYSGTLEIARITDEFRTKILGEILDVSDKVLLEKSDAKTVDFAMLYEVNGDVKASRKLFYRCAVSRPSESASTTTNTKEPSTETLNITVSPLADGRVRASTTAETVETAYNSWYEKVWEPTV